MEHRKEHFRHVLLFYFRKGKKAAEAHKQLCEVYGFDSLGERTCQNWFKKFRSGDFSLKDEQRSGRPSEVDDDQIKAIIEMDRHITVREVSDRLNVSHTTIEKHLKSLGLVKKLGIWVPHELDEIHLTQRINTCDMYLKRNEVDPFLKRIITGDQKCIVYNINRKRSWSKREVSTKTASEPGVHQKKILLSVWWDYKGVIYFEVFPQDEIITSEIYCEQLSKLEKAIKEKRPELTDSKRIMFHQYSEKLHKSLETRVKLLELGWEVMLYLPYSPDLAPSDYHLFQTLQNSLNIKTFTSDADIKNYLDQYFTDNGQKFYERGIMKLPERWQKVIENNGKYIKD